MSGAPASREQITWWMWPQVLSLDVVAVFVVWSLLLARTFGGNAAGATLLAGSSCVWSIYIADHLIDGSRGADLPAARHQFVFRYRSLFIVALVAAISMGLIAAGALSPSVRRAGLLLSVPVVLYLLLVHL